MNSTTNDAICALMASEGQLQARVATLEAALAEAREDSKRMDYLEGEMAYEQRCIEHGQLIPSSLFRRNVPITRAAIDSARGGRP